MVRARRGIALVLTLLITVLVVVLATQLAYTVGVDARLSQNQLAQTQNFALAYGGVEIAKTFLQSDFDNSGEEKADTMREDWANPAETDQAIVSEENELRIRITSEEGKFNLNHFANEDMRELSELVSKQILVALGYDESLSEALYAAVDDATEGEAPITTIYDIVCDEIPYEMVVGDSLGLVELDLHPGGDETIGLDEVFTVISYGNINVNLAEKHVFQGLCAAMPDSVKAGTSDEDLATKYVEYRGEPGDEEGTDMTEVPQLSNVEGFDTEAMRAYLEGEDGEDVGARLRGLFTIGSSTFKVEILTENGTLSGEYEAYLRRDTEDGTCRLLFWKELETPSGTR